jgi:hypothetical protein
VRSSVPSATASPRPTSPITFSAGTRTSSKTGWPVGEPWIPSLCSYFGTEKPGRSFSTTNAVLRRAARSVTANTT